MTRQRASNDFGYNQVGGLFRRSGMVSTNVVAIASNRATSVPPYLWRAVHYEDELLESNVTKTRDKEAALTFMKKGLSSAVKPSGPLSTSSRIAS